MFVFAVVGFSKCKSLYLNEREKCYGRDVFTRIHQTLRETGCLPSVAVHSEREVVRTINTRENVLEMVQRSPHLSTRRMASRIGVLRMQVWRTLHEFLYPYHDQMVHLEPGDHAQRMDLCQWMTAHPELSSVILFTDEASFTRDGINNSRNMHTWSNENPHETRVTNKEIFRDIATVIDLGYSDHKAQVLQLTVKKVLLTYFLFASVRLFYNNI